MAIWKPKPFIRVKVLGLVWRGSELLAGEVENSAGQVTGVRPLGGCVEFGETREEALRREFREELGCETIVSGPWHSLENIFEHEGSTGHEYIFAADLQLLDPRLYAKDRLEYLEDDGARCAAAWFSPAALPQGVDLYPIGLLELIRSDTTGNPEPLR